MGSSDTSKDQSPEQAEPPFQPGHSGLLTTTVPGQPTGDNLWHDTDQASATIDPDRPSDGVATDSTDNDSNLGENALSVLLSALSSAQNTMAAHDPPKPTDAADDDSSIALITGAQESSHQTHSATQDVATGSVYAADGDPTAAFPSVLGSGHPAGTATDNVATSGTQTYGATSAVTAVADPSVQATETAPDPLAQATPFTVNGQPVTASREGSAMVLAVDSQTVTALPVSTVKLASQDFGFHSDGKSLAAGTATFAIPDRADPKPTDSLSKWTKDGSFYTAALQDGSAELEGPSVTTTVPAGAKATIAGEVLSMPFGGAVVPGAHLASSHSTSSRVASGSDQSVQNFDDFVASATASAAGSAVVVYHGSMTFTLNAGQQTEVADHTLSVASDNGAVIVDGSRSVSVVPAPTTDNSSTNTMPSESSIEGARMSDAEATTATTPSAESAVVGTWTTQPQMSYLFACVAILLVLI